ncbi:hypothetical protein HYW21_05890 [Candidatus Woesearchaeota archaeon]|nr:hypothetical protein [Candidatus Woesearchaeota archaeon]
MIIQEIWTAMRDFLVEHKNLPWWAKIIIGMVWILITAMIILVWFTDSARDVGAFFVCPSMGCDDSNPCTKDTCGWTLKGKDCLHTSLSGKQSLCNERIGPCKQQTCYEGSCNLEAEKECCGNDICDQSEDYAHCVVDCEISITEHYTPSETVSEAYADAAGYRVTFKQMQLPEGECFLKYKIGDGMVDITINNRTSPDTQTYWGWNYYSFDCSLLQGIDDTITIMSKNASIRIFYEKQSQDDHVDYYTFDRASWIGHDGDMAIDIVQDRKAVGE